MITAESTGGWRDTLVVTFSPMPYLVSTVFTSSVSYRLNRYLDPAAFAIQTGKAVDDASGSCLGKPPAQPPTGREILRQHRDLDSRSGIHIRVSVRGADNSLRDNLHFAGIHLLRIRIMLLHRHSGAGGRR